MGRVAGPLSKRSIANAWKQTVKKENYLRQVERPMAMAVVPHRSNRLMSLLWVIVTYRENGLVVGTKGSPPYTGDMRELVRRGPLRYGRRWSQPGGLGFNFVIATEAGKAKIKATIVSDEQIRYIGNAFGSSSIR